MKIRKAIVSAVVVGGVAASALVAAGPANAEALSTQATANCPSGYTCAWKDYDYLTAGSSSARVTFQNFVADYSQLSYGGYSAGKSITSVYNNGNSERSRLYTATNYHGIYFTLSDQQGDADLNNTAGVVGTSEYNDALYSGQYGAGF